jgi:hypothetical protein
MLRFDSTVLDYDCILFACIFVIDLGLLSHTTDPANVVWLREPFPWKFLEVKPDGELSVPGAVADAEDLAEVICRTRRLYG